MTWRDNYRPGAFRGAPFHLQRSSSSGGRRTVLNEFPLRDEPVTEDLGRRARQFSLVMTVIGPDYMTDRDRLIEALETNGPGTLMHPFRGELYVAVLGDYSCEESTEQGGLARISATFVEAGEMPRPDSLQAQGSQANASADTLLADALGEFLDGFELDGWAAYVFDAALGVLEWIFGEVSRAGNLFKGGSLFTSRYKRLAGNAEQLLQSPGDLGWQLVELVQGISVGSSPLQALKAQQGLFNLGSRIAAVTSGSPYQSAARTRMAANQTALLRLVERAAIGEAVRLATSKPAASVTTNGSTSGATSSSGASTLPGNSASSGGTYVAGSAPQNRPAGIRFSSRDQAIAIRDRLLAELDRQQLAAAPAHYRPLAQLAADLVSEMNGRVYARSAQGGTLAPGSSTTQIAASLLVGQLAGQVASLAPLSRMTPQATLPALLLAHRLYGNARLADDVVSRNGLSHPGFVPGGQELEVLKNA